MKQSVFFLIGILASAASVQADGVYRVVGWDIPETVYPGQQVHGKFSVEVVAPGDPVFTRPFATLTSQVDSSKRYELPGRKMMPWILKTDQKPGETLSVGFLLDVPMDFPAGPADLSLVVTRKTKDWEYATIEDGTGKGGKGKNFKITLRVGKGDGSEEAETFEPPLVVHRMARPTLDGKIDAAEWKSAAVIESFDANKDGEVKAGTKAYVGYDEKNFYMAFVCDEPAMRKTGRVKLSGHDRKIYNTNETVYLFLNPQADRASFMQFIVDILNQRYDALGMDLFGFNPPWESSVWEGESSWSVEVAIPFASLTVSTPKAGQAWCADFFRVRQAELEVSAWRPTASGFETPSRFGTLVFESLGKYLENEAAGLDVSKTDYPKELAEEGNQWREKVQKLRKTVSELTEEQAVADYASLMSKIESLRKEGEALNRRVMRLAGKGLVVTKTRPYQLFTGKPFNDDEPAGPMQATMLQDEWVDLAWNLTNMTDRAMTVRCFTLTGKEEAGGYDFLHLPILGLEANWFQAMPVATGDNRPMWDAIVPTPAGVVRIGAGETAQVWLTLHAPAEAGAGVQDFRVMIQPIDGSAFEPITVPLSVRVQPYCITAKRYFNLFTWNVLPPEVMDNKAWFDAHLDDMAAHGVNVFLLHNLRLVPRCKANPDGTLTESAESMDFSRLDRAIDASRGKFDRYYMTLDIWEKLRLRTDLIGLDFDDPNYGKAFKAWFKIVLDHLKAKGIGHDKLIVNPYDECTNEKCQRIARWIKEVDPECRVVIDWSPADMDEARAMDALTDVWVPHHRQFFPDELQPFHKMVRESKKEYWCYYYSEGPNEKAQDPTLHYLAKFWWSYEMNLKGMGYWACQYYGDPWYRKPSATRYDTSLVYPVQGGVIPSRRWQAWRRGWQDYNLISILREKLEKNGNQEGLKKLDKCIRDVVSCPGNPVKRESARDWIKSEL